MKWYWECPICHQRLSRSNPNEIDKHKASHPKNQRTFTAGRCPRLGNCALYPDLCPDASNSSTYHDCAIMKGGSCERP